MGNRQRTTEYVQRKTDTDTIAAVATPIGQAGIGIIRISGPLTNEIAEKIFKSKNPTKGLRSHHLYLGYLLDPSTGETIDYCIERHGIWLDKGEFENILLALESEAYSKPSDEYIHQALEEAKEIVIGPDNFISEWKDFATVAYLLQLRILVENPRLKQTLITLQESSPFK